MNASLLLMSVIGLLAVTFLGAAALVGFFIWRDELRWQRTSGEGVSREGS